MKGSALAVLVAMLAIIVPASSAQAAAFHAGQAGALILGTGPGSPSKITTDDTTVSCTESFFGAKTGALKTVWTENSSLLKIVPSYSKCTYGGGLSAAFIHVTGCRLQFTLGAEISSGVYGGTLGIVNTGECVNSEIYVERGTCRWAFPVQEGHATVEFSNTKSEKVNAISAKLSLTGMNYSLSGICGAKTGSYSDGKWQETVTLVAQKESGEPVAFEIL